jgi:hypothetical protein
VLPPQLERALAPIRPHPHRGDLIAAGAVPLATAIALLNVRMDGVWGDGVHLVITWLGAALLLLMGWLAPLEQERPRAYHTTLLVAGLALLVIALVRLAQVLGVDDPVGADGARLWISALLAVKAGWFARRLNSPQCLLIAAVAAGVATLAFVDLVFDPEGRSTMRWILLLLIGAYIFAAISMRDRKPAHAVQLANAAGLANAVLILSFGIGSLFGIFGVEGPGTGWELVMFGVAFGLIAYAGVEGERGPGYLGVVELVGLALVVGVTGGDATILGWPLLFLLAGGAAIGAGLRPRRELPPMPGDGEEATVVLAPVEPPADRPPA